MVILIQKSFGSAMVYTAVCLLSLNITFYFVCLYDHWVMYATWRTAVICPASMQANYILQRCLSNIDRIVIASHSDVTIS